MRFRFSSNTPLMVFNSKPTKSNSVVLFGGGGFKGAPKADSMPLAPRNETMAEPIVGIYLGESKQTPDQGFLGDAGFRPSTARNPKMG